MYPYTNIYKLTSISYAELLPQKHLTILERFLQILVDRKLF